MRINFGFDAKLNRIELIATSPRMDLRRGEGKLEIGNQGRFGKRSRFLQETEAIGQQTPRIGANRPKLRFTHRVSSAGRTGFSNFSPHLFFLKAPQQVSSS
jgi:hypothetical protein